MFLSHSYTSISNFLVRLSLVHPSIRPSIYLSVHWFVSKLFLRLFVASSKVFPNVLVCSSVCLPDFFESADARDLGLMTLFLSFPHFPLSTTYHLLSLNTICYHLFLWDIFPIFHTQNIGKRQSKWKFPIITADSVGTKGIYFIPFPLHDLISL